MESFLDDDFEYSVCDKYTGLTWSLKLKDSIEESNKLKKINREKEYLMHFIINAF